MVTIDEIKEIKTFLSEGKKYEGEAALASNDFIEMDELIQAVKLQDTLQGKEFG